MKKALAFVFAAASGVYLLTIGIAPDPLPFIDEATALLVLVKSLSVLGIDISRFLPFLGKKGAKAEKKDGPVVDV
ncbi:MAG: hypothetical protein AAGI48_12760 [Verrucomicrobiota bacterium]